MDVGGFLDAAGRGDLSAMQRRADAGMPIDSTDEVRAAAIEVLTRLQTVWMDCTPPRCYAWPR